MRRDQKGYTIAELLIAVTILAIVVAAVCGFIIVGSRSYAAGNSDINTQQEAQLALNQMSDVLIDTTRSVIYAAYDAAGDRKQALKDAEFSFTPKDKSLIMFNGVVEKNPGGGADTLKDGNGNKHYHFYWNKEKETLFYAEQDIESDVVDSTDILAKFPDPAAADPDADPADTEWYVLASHVTDFSADLSQVEEKRVVQLALTFLDGTKEYITSNNVTIRNKVGVNDVELAPLNKSVEINISVKSSFILEPGETFTLPTPKVTGKNVTDKSVTWSFVDTPADDGPGPESEPATSLTTDGILTLSIRAKGSFEVMATTNAEDSEHNQASAKVTIHVKRVTGIDLWKSYDSAGNPEHVVSPGCTFTISGRVKGDYLDQTCDCCGEDTSIDRHILSKKSPILGSDEHVWRVWDPHIHATQAEIAANGWENWHPSQDIIEVDQDEFSATFKVEQHVSDAGDHGYVIQVMSLLSYYRYGPGWKGRRYDWVWPAYDFTVKPKTSSNISPNSSLHWGASTIFSWEFDAPYAVVCVRFIEDGEERIIIFQTEGKTIQVVPDTFGVKDISKQCQISIQVLEPKPGSTLPSGVSPNRLKEMNRTGQLVENDTLKELIDDYLENCKDGTYVGTAYNHSDKISETIYPPEIFYQYDGKDMIGGELKLKKASTLGGPEWTEFKVSHVKNTVDDPIGGNFANINIAFSMYQEMPDGMKWFYGYKEETGEVAAGNPKPYGDGFDVTDIKNPNAAKIKLDLINRHGLSEAAGKYRLIPYIIYEQNENADHNKKDFIYYVNYIPNYNVTQTYKEERSTVYYELVSGGNLELWSCNRETQNADEKQVFTLGEIYFPTPADLSTSEWKSSSDFDYYFTISDLQKDSSWHVAKQSGTEFIKVDKGSGSTTKFKPSTIRCKYVGGIYELELYYIYYDAAWKRYGEICAGTFRWEEGDDRWDRTPGPCDSQIANGSTELLGPTAALKFMLYDTQKTWNIYIPLPSEMAFNQTGYGGFFDNGFGFALKQNTEQLVYNKKLKFRWAGEQKIEDADFSEVRCTYDAAADKYTLVLSYGNDKHTFTCTSDGKEWIQQ